jgi:hypothetical protein
MLSKVSPRNYIAGNKVSYVYTWELFPASGSQFIYTAVLEIYRKYLRKKYPTNASELCQFEVYLQIAAQA